MPQTDYRTVMPVGIEGAIADDSPAVDIESRVSSTGTATEIPFGRPVASVSGSSAKACVLCTDYSYTPIGIAAHSHSYAAGELGTSGIKSGSMVNVLRHGRIRVKAGGSIADGQGLHYQTSTGKWVTAAVAADTIDMTGQVIARSAGVLNDLVIAEIDMSNKA